MDKIACGRCSVSQITQFRRCIFSKTINSFRHLELEIALAIPAANDEKYNWNNSAGQGLSANYVYSRFIFFLQTQNCMLKCALHLAEWHMFGVIFTHLKLWIEIARHNFKWVKIYIPQLSDLKVKTLERLLVDNVENEIAVE